MKRNKVLAELVAQSIENYEAYLSTLTPEQQAIYFKSGRSKTMNSNHLKRCAIDLFVFKDGKLLSTKEEMQPIGNAWESLSKENRWGGNFSGFVDIPHFQRDVV